MAVEVSRIAWVDNLRTAIIVMVVNMHACVTYSHVGSWYIKEVPEPAMGMKLAFIVWQFGLQSFFMGLLFFVAGFFSHRSLGRRGPARFLLERAFRLGLPALLYMAIIHPFMVFVLLGHPRIPDRPPLGALCSAYVASGDVLRGSGPLWFVLALLLFSAVLASWRSLRPASSQVMDPGGVAAPGPSMLLIFGIALGLVTFGVRLVQPIGTNVLNFQLCFFPQYIAAFAVGVAAGRNGWLEALANSPRARVAGWLGVTAGPALLVLLLALGGPPTESGPYRYEGGANWRAFGLALWEQLAGLGLGLGTLALFRKRWTQAGRFARWLSDRSFGVYVLHAPVLVALTPLLRPLDASPFAKALLLTGLGVSASFAAAEIAHRVPGLRRVL
ncbi:MAG: acyltransferase [Verrucomicrobia bacterium]|nr:acyltransferase [Verrucomicrobiota bacterium]OQC67750.1 MAG: glucans biosynthesis protein [Verrucomicrobia bacterium ADurb.Bin006]MDI9379898.1 acyltransferase [Verrucomicrobiota bacterium]NMD21969.1 acyltransferase [Verrucomicrobiota bacterium]HOA61551.1 acyltransferase [Verrucomicrobiota bacterium]